VLVRSCDSEDPHPHQRQNWLALIGAGRCVVRSDLSLSSAVRLSPVLSANTFLLVLVYLRKSPTLLYGILAVTSWQRPQHHREREREQ